MGRKTYIIFAGICTLLLGLKIGEIFIGGRQPGRFVATVAASMLTFPNIISLLIMAAWKEEVKEQPMVYTGMKTTAFAFFFVMIINWGFTFSAPYWVTLIDLVGLIAAFLILCAISPSEVDWAVAKIKKLCCCRCCLDRLSGKISQPPVSLVSVQTPNGNFSADADKPEDHDNALSGEVITEEGQGQGGRPVPVIRVTMHEDTEEAQGACWSSQIPTIRVTMHGDTEESQGAYCNPQAPVVPVPRNVEAKGVQDSRENSRFAVNEVSYYEEIEGSKGGVKKP